MKLKQTQPGGRPRAASTVKQQFDTIARRASSMIEPSVLDAFVNSDIEKTEQRGKADYISAGQLSQ